MSTTQVEVPETVATEPVAIAEPVAAATEKPVAFSLDASEQQLLDEFGVLYVAGEYTYGA